MGSIASVVVSGDVIDSIVEHLDGVLEGVPDSHKVIALIAYALSIQKPDMTPEQAVHGAEETTRFMCLFLSNLDDEKLTDEEKRLKIN